MNAKSWTRVAIVLLALILAVSCAPKRETVVVERSVEVEKPVERQRQSAAPMAGAPAPEQPQLAADSASQESVGERMIIRTVNMSVIVEDTDKAVEQINALLKTHKGYVANSRRWYVSDAPYAHITLRVPAESLDEVMAQLRAMVIKVENENVSGQDVTEQYADNAARLRNLEATEKELLTLLTQVRENRGKAEDILAVYRELTNIRAQIEQIKGRQQYLERMTALATIEIAIRPREAPKPLVEAETWNPLITTNRALRAFVTFLRVLIDVAIYLIIFGWPVALLIVIIWLLTRRARRRKAQKKAEAAPKGQ